MIDRFDQALASYLNAGYPLIGLTTQEEERAIQIIRRLAEGLLVPRQVFTWSATRGLQGPAPLPDTRSPHRALEFIEGYTHPAIFVMLDFHGAWRGAQGRTADHQLVRMMRELAEALRGSPVPRNLLLLSPSAQVPPDLEHEAVHLDLPLPVPSDLLNRFAALVMANLTSGWLQRTPAPEEMGRLARAGAGLTLVQAEQSLMRALVEDPLLANAERILLEEKRQVIRRSEILEWVETEAGLEQVGGLEHLKSWLVRRSKAWDESARRWHLPAPRGMLLTGVPGCGKSLVAKAVGGAWGLPLLRLDMGKVFAGLVGSSEANMRAAIRTAEAVAPAVLWIDEIEKGLAGRGGTSDGGIATRVFGTLLTWMQEREKPVFVLATANAIDQLPPELLRKGRFDEIFFVDLPTVAERAAIFAVHLRIRLRDPYVSSLLPVDAALLEELARLTEGFIGAEIEQIIVDGLFTAFAADRPLLREDLLSAIRETIPLSVTQSERLTAMRQWARERAVLASIV